MWATILEDSCLILLIESVECTRQCGCQAEKVPLKMTSGSYL